jgi:hypothetical protein
MKRLPASTKLANANRVKQLRSVLRQAAVTRLPMTKQVLDDMERMLNLGAHAGLQVF